SHGDSGTLIFGPKPARDCLDRAPGGNSSVRIEVPSNPVISVVFTSGVVHMKHDKVRSPVSADVGDGNAGFLVFGPEPAGYGSHTTPEWCHRISSNAQPA